MSQLENLDLRYPEALVRQHGAKAGLLEHVVQHMLHIPQMPMVVREIGESPRDFLARVDQAGIGWPRIFRSSAIVELVGFEGVFPTHTVDTFKGEDKILRYFNLDGGFGPLVDDAEFNQRLEDLVGEIACSPQKMVDRDQLPPEINVIAAEVAPSLYRGTFIKHPNRPNFYLATITEGNSVYRQTLTYEKGMGFREFGSWVRNLITLTEGIKRQLREVIRWHDCITKLPEMDPRWTYQIEFGLMPTQLFQVRPFKPIQMANFTFDSRRVGPFEPIVIGVTDEEGDNYEKVSTSTRTQKTNLPALLLTSIHRIVRFPTHIANKPQAYLFFDSGGILSHKDTKVLRESNLALLYSDKPQRDLADGTVLNIKSNGIETRITDVITGLEIY